MKRLTTNGGVTTVQPPRPAPSIYVRKARDPFPSHGFPNGLFTEVSTDLGYSLFLYGWDILSSGNQFYVWANEAEGDDMFAAYTAWQEFTTPGISGFHEGEAYNFFIKPRTTDKFDDDQLADYLSTH